MTLKEKYINSLKLACNEMKLDFFPQVEASELLFKVITLEDIYLPLSLIQGNYDHSPYPADDAEIDEIIRMIDAKIQALEAELAREDDQLNESNLKEISNQSSEDENKEESSTAHRILIEAEPGSGKTTFCKRLVLAFLNNDDEFFSKYSKENNLVFDTANLPVLLSCKYISEFSKEELTTLDFDKIMYRICARDFGNHFANISEADFIKIVSTTENQNLCIILDGWDELLNKDIAVFFQNRLEQYAKTKPKDSIVITSRFSYAAPKLGELSTERFRIRSFSDDDIRKFCKKWFEKILSPNQSRFNNSEIITNQILNSKDLEIRHMMHNPLELSLLLTVSKNDGLLPGNRADLFGELVDLHIFWNANKSKSKLSHKTVRVLLAYIATQFTKRNQLHCDENTLVKIIKQAITDLDFVFSEDVSNLDARDIAKELSHTGILTKTYDGNRYSFSETKYGSHRLMQEYLTAYAILAQYTDEEYNNMSPVEILSDKYTLSQWGEVIIFIVLMKNGRVRQEIINDLLDKCKEDVKNCYYYTNLLFSFVMQKAEINITSKHKIYDVIFQNRITDRQIDYIIDLVKGKSKTSVDFAKHITEKYENSIKNGRQDYVYPYAIILASTKLLSGLSPFEYAYQLMLSGKEADIFVGLNLLRILAWCKYSDISNVLVSRQSKYKMPLGMIVRLKALAKTDKYSYEAIKCIKETIVAKYVTTSKFFDSKAVKEAYAKLDKKEQRRYSELVLSFLPVFSSRFKANRDVDCKTKNLYLKRLTDEIKNEDTDNLIYTYCICVAIGCFSHEEKEKTWEKIRDLYNNSKGVFGRTRFVQLDEKYLNMLRANFFSRFKVPAKLSAGSGQGPWILEEMNHLSAEYIDQSDNVVMRIMFPDGELCEDAKDFFDTVINKSIATNNNLAYLLRRKEITEVTIINNTTSTPTPLQLLGEGAREFDAFSTINTALSISKIYKNELGNYRAGKEYISQALRFMNNHPLFWRDASTWWIKLAIERKEYEGIVVLTWLYSLGTLDISQIKKDVLLDIASRLSFYHELDDDILKFEEEINKIVNEHS